MVIELSGSAPGHARVGRPHFLTVVFLLFRTYLKLVVLLVFVRLE